MMRLTLLPFYPLVSFWILIWLNKKLTWLQVSVLSVGAMLLCTLTSLLLLNQLYSPDDAVITAHLWRWFSLQSGDSFASVNFAFRLDGLSAVMINVVSGIGFLIHLFAAAYMKNDDNVSRFMAYMNLFIVAMLMLVLADNLVLLYLGWEGVGLCSFLLIGFWYQEKSNVLAAIKSFSVTRIGYTSMASGWLLLFT